MRTYAWMAKSVLSVFLIVFMSACNTALNESENDLKTSLSDNAIALENAVSSITGSSEFQIFYNSTSGPAKVAAANADYLPDSIEIKLADISGVYEYSKVRIKNAPFDVLRYFERTGDSDQLIVKFPLNKAKNYGSLFKYTPADSLLTNNFGLKVSDYYWKLSSLVGREYRLSSTFELDSVVIAGLKINFSKNKVNGYNYSSEYSMTDSYTVVNTENSGDTAVSVYSIRKSDKVLFEEKISSYKSSTERKHRERIYSLTIGNVQIIRTAGLNSLDSAKVLLNGVLQTNAKVEIVQNDENDDTQHSIMDKKRDVRITFDDGTTTTIRELTANSIDNIGMIFRMVRQADFAVNIIDRIAFNLHVRNS